MAFGCKTPGQIQAGWVLLVWQRDIAGGIMCKPGPVLGCAFIYFFSKPLLERLKCFEAPASVVSCSMCFGVIASKLQAGVGRPYIYIYIFL